MHTNYLRRASERMSGVADVEMDDDDNAANTARRTTDAAMIAAALKASDSWGDEKLQDFLLALLVKLTAEHHPTLLASVKPGTPDCRVRALCIIEEFIVLKTGHTTQELDHFYNMLKNGLAKPDDVYEYFQKRLQAHVVKTHVGLYFNVTLTDSSKQCMQDYITMLTRVHGFDSPIISHA